MVLLNITMDNGINIMIDSGNNGEIVTFLDVYYIFKKALESRPFSMSVNMSHYVGSVEIPYDSNITDWFEYHVSESRHPITVNILMEVNPYNPPRSLRMYNDTSFIRYIEAIKEAVDQRLEISDNNEAMIEEMVEDLSRLVGDAGILRNVFISTGIFSPQQFQSNRFTVLLGTRRVEHLSAAAFNAIPSAIYATPENSDEDDALCVVCQTDFEDGDDMKVLRCNHRFHTDCIQTWLTQEHSVCPLCRLSVTDVEEDVVISTVDVREEVPNDILFGTDNIGTAINADFDSDEGSDFRRISFGDVDD
jgi:hypothetical protein